MTPRTIIEKLEQKAEETQYYGCSDELLRVLQTLALLRIADALEVQNLPAIPNIPLIPQPFAPMPGPPPGVDIVW